LHRYGGQAFSFNGVDGYVDLGNNPSLDTPGSSTTEAWVNYETLTHSKYLIADFDASGTVSQGSLVSWTITSSGSRA